MTGEGENRVLVDVLRMSLNAEECIQADPPIVFLESLAEARFSFYFHFSAFGMRKLARITIAPVHVGQEYYDYRARPPSSTKIQASRMISYAHIAYVSFAGTAKRGYTRAPLFAYGHRRSGINDAFDRSPSAELPLATISLLTGLLRAGK